jgi:ABC-2 type transport system permease protein
VINMNQTNSESKKSIPSSMAHVGITTKYSLLDYVRSRRFFILLTITILIAAILTAVVGYYRPEGMMTSNLAFYSEWWGRSVTFVIVLTGIFFGADAISSEFQNKTGYFSITNPIKRSSIYIGKWLAAFIASTAILAVFTVITLGNGFYYFGLNVPVEFLQSVLFSWLYLIAVLGFSFFFSSFFKSSSMSILVTAILFLFVFDMIQLLIVNFVQIEPWFILTYGSSIIGNVMSVPYPPHATTVYAGDTTFTMFNATIPEGLAIITVYFAVTAVLGLLLFERKEFN